MKNLNYLFILICTYLGRIILFGANFPEAVVFIACISYLLINKYLKHIKIEKYNSSVDEKINKIEEEVKKVSASAAALQIGNTYSMQRK
jgi:C4-dicarboxylate transporter